MDIFSSNHGLMPLRFTVCHKKHEWHYLCFRNYTLKTVCSMVSPLLSIGLIFIHIVVQLCTVIHVYFYHLCGLQTAGNTPGKFDTRTKEVCTVMRKNNAWIQSMCRVIYRSYERRLSRH